MNITQLNKEWKELIDEARGDEPNTMGYDAEALILAEKIRARLEEARALNSLQLVQALKDDIEIKNIPPEMRIPVLNAMKAIEYQINGY